MFTSRMISERNFNPRFTNNYTAPPSSIRNFRVESCGITDI